MATIAHAEFGPSGGDGEPMPSADPPSHERALLRAIEDAPFGVGVVDEDLRQVGANRSLRATGVPEAAREHVRKVLLTGATERVEALRGGDGAGYRASFHPVGAGTEHIGVLLERLDDRVLAERAALERALAERELAQATIDALTTELAILDEHARIVTVNKAWREFGTANGWPDAVDPVGQDYLGVCDVPAPHLSPQDDLDGARSFAEGLRSVLRGERDRFELEYPCHSPDEQRWFVARVSRFQADGARRVVVAHENITTRRVSEERNRLIARTLQQSLLPSTLPEPPGLELAARYRAHGEGLVVGGDFYDAFEAGGGWVIVVGDVCGKGPEAAAVTAQARWTIRALARVDQPPSAVLRALNAAMVRDRDDGIFCTIALTHLHPTESGWTAHTATAGHPSPLVVRAGVAETLPTRGPLIGALPAIDPADVTTDLAPGDALVLFSDGVVEARVGAELFGEERLAAALSVPGAGACDLVARAEEAVLSFTGGTVKDDLAILVARVAG